MFLELVALFYRMLEFKTFKKRFIQIVVKVYSNGGSISSTKWYSMQILLRSERQHMLQMVPRAPVPGRHEGQKLLP